MRTNRGRNAIHTTNQDGSVRHEAVLAGSMRETVLIAEDDPIFRRLLQSRLSNWGYSVIAVNDGTEAWRLLQEVNPPELLILDWIMPGIDGIELCRRIRGTQGERYQYILLVSGKDEKQDVVAGLDAGADDYLTKPFDIGELRARLLAGNRILTLQRELIQAREALRFRATHDDLTGLWSRGATQHLLACELQRSARSRAPIGVLMIDLDHFKSVNDTYGHLVGDAVLKEAGCRISAAVRNYDFVGRYGGEEFLVVLSNCTLADLQGIAERTRATFSNIPVPTDAGNVSVTISVGGAFASSETSELELLAAADSALYDAKRGGRNRVVIGSCPAGQVPHVKTLEWGTQLTP